MDCIFPLIDCKPWKVSLQSQSSLSCSWQFVITFITRKAGATDTEDCTESVKGVCNNQQQNLFKSLHFISDFLFFFPLRGFCVSFPFLWLVPSGFEVMTVQATDPDEENSDNSDVCYRIIRQEPEEPNPSMFAINTTTGLITVDATGLDREVRSNKTTQPLL